MITPRRLRRPEAKREHLALRLAATARRQGIRITPWQVDALRWHLDKGNDLRDIYLVNPRRTRYLAS